MSDVFTKNRAKYEGLFKNGASHERIQRVMAEDLIEDERAELKRAELHDVDAFDRAKITELVEFAAKQRRIPPPRIRFFKSAGFHMGGIVYVDTPNEIWIAGDRPLHEMRRLALHETAHVDHLATDTPKELREHDADRFAWLGRHWA